MHTSKENYLYYYKININPLIYKGSTNITYTQNLKNKKNPGIYIICTKQLRKSISTAFISVDITKI